MKLFHALLTACVLFCLTVHAQVPRTLSYQGILADSLGNPKPDALYSFTFRLYDAVTNGSVLWTETKSLEVKRGLFSTVLGDQTAIGPSVAFDRQYWLSVQLEGQAELTPRIPLTAVGYSLNSAAADTAGYARSAPLQMTVDSARIAGRVPDSSVTAGEIARHQVVKSLNSLSDNVTIKAGANVTITPLNDTLTIASTGGGNLSGSGATNQVTFWSSPTTLSGDSSLVWDGASKFLGIGTAVPMAPLTVRRMNAPALTQAVKATISGSNPQLSAVMGVTESDQIGSAGAGVMGMATSASGLSSGVIGRAEGLTSAGVMGVAGNSAGANYGVLGTSNSTSGTGVYGSGLMAGVLGNSTSTSGFSYGTGGSTSNPEGYGVWGWNSATSGVAIATFGASFSPDGSGVYGQNDVNSTVAAGVKGVSLYGRGVYGASRRGFGVYAHSDSGIALKATYNAEIHGTTAVDSIAYLSPRTHYLTVPGEAFLPASVVPGYGNTGGMGGAWISSGVYTLATSINLPHGALITKFTVYYYDNSASDVTIILKALQLAGGSYVTLTSLGSSGTPGYSSGSTSSINYSLVDNLTYGYSISANCPSWDSTNLRIMGATVEYTISQAE